jgi:hypothetical protein
MKLIAHVTTDGQLEHVIAIESSDRAVTLRTSEPGIVCELVDHGVGSLSEDLRELRQIIEQHVATVTPARAVLTKRHSQA